MIYLDNASTSWPKLETVHNVCKNFLEHCSGSYKRTFDKEDKVEIIRKASLDYFDASDAQIAFVPSATIAMNVLINSFRDKEIVTTNCEHHCVYRTLNGFNVKHKVVEYYDNNLGENATNILNAITPDTRLVIMNHGSNVTGDIYDVAKVGEELRKRNIYFAVDISQTVGYEDISMEEMKCDVLIGTAHKHLHSITGTGFIVFRKNVNIKSFYFGGTGRMSGGMFQPDVFPDKIEAGTADMISILSFYEAIKEISKEKREYTRIKEKKLVSMFKSECRNINGIKIIDTSIENKSGVVSINVKDFDPTLVIAPYLWNKGEIMVRPGLHCAPLIHKTLGTSPTGTIRISVSKYTTENEIYSLLDALEQLCKENG